MIITVGAFFWLLALAAVFRLVRIGAGPVRSRWLELGLLFAFAALLLFRPHEDIFGGEDPGSYLNSGITYNRQNKLFYVDELLAKVPAATRPFFYYGHAGYGATKDACLWVRNPEMALVGAHFQPAYPLMTACAARIGLNSWALFVVPLFAIFTAIALRALALLTIPQRWAGLIVFIIYIFNPLTIWHGRCARPEIIASFMFFAGSALTLQVWRARPWKNWIDLLLGAACIGVAPLFHITAWLLVIPALVVVVIALLRAGREDFLPYLLISGLMLTAFYAETKYVTDYYTVKRFLDLVFLRPELIAAGFILLTILALSSKKFLAARLSPASPPRTPVSLFLSLMFGLCLIAFFLSLTFFRQIYGDLPVLGRPINHYLYLTDFRVVNNMLSLPVMLLILAGLVAWLTGRAEHRARRLVLALILLPAIMLTGNINDFMMTRYLLVAFIPAAALLLTALIAMMFPRESGLWKPLILCILVCVLALYHRTHLITTTEHRGFCRFLRPYAEIIKTNKGMLLCEYSRVAAPLEHFFGVPTLGLDSERQDDYEPAEKAWAAIMRSAPDRAAYFATPYHVPASTLFSFEPVYLNTFQDSRLEQARQALPTKVGKSDLSLRLFKMRLKQPALPNYSNSVEVITPDAGNMGMRYFANMRNELLSLPARELPADTASALSLAAVNLPEFNLLLFLMGDESEGHAPALKASSPTADLPVDLIPLGANLFLARISGFRGEKPDAITIKPSARLYLAKAYAVGNGQTTPLALDRPAAPLRQQWISARWARARAKVLLPVPDRRPGLLMILLKAPDPDSTGEITLQLSCENQPLAPPRKITAEQWQWQIWQLPAAATNSTIDIAWLTIQTKPAWNPGKPDFPRDLGILISRIVCLPFKE